MCMKETGSHKSCHPFCLSFKSARKLLIVSSPYENMNILNICCEYWLDTPYQGTPNKYHNICSFCGEIRKILTIFGWKGALLVAIVCESFVSGIHMSYTN